MLAISHRNRFNYVFILFNTKLIYSNATLHVSGQLGGHTPNMHTSTRAGVRARSRDQEEQNRYKWCFIQKDDLLQNKKLSKLKYKLIYRLERKTNESNKHERNDVKSYTLDAKSLYGIHIHILEHCVYITSMRVYVMIISFFIERRVFLPRINFQRFSE